MLTKIIISSPQDKESVLREHLDTFFRSNENNPSTWIVSDLTSKLNLQQEFLELQPCIDEDSVLRASELWRKLAFRMYPEWSVLSRELATRCVEHAMKNSKHHFDWKDSSSASMQLHETVGLFLGVLTHPEGRGRLGEWFSRHPDSYLRWGEWFLESEEVWKNFNDNKWMSSAWLSQMVLAHLNTSEWSTKFWNRKLIIDIGFDFNPVEAEIIKILSRYLDITLLVPKFSDEADVLKQSYATLDFASSTSRKVAWEKESNKADTNGELKSHETVSKEPIGIRRFSSMLSEVKDATAQVRIWLDAGIAPTDVIVVAPNSKAYARSLKNHLDIEGIPVSVEAAGLLTDLPHFRAWLSKLWLRCESPKTAWLEDFHFSNNEQLITFEKFHHLFSKIYDESDLKRLQELWLTIRANWNPDKLMSKRNFLAASLSYIHPDLAKEQMDLLEGVISKILKDGPLTLSMSFKDWVSYLEQSSRRMDISADGMVNGVSLVDLDSCDDVRHKWVYFLGLSEELTKQTGTSHIDTLELLKLSSELGFAFPIKERNRLELKASWFLAGQKESVISYPESTLEGDILAPSLLWLRSALRVRSSQDIEKVDQPQQSRWDEIQRYLHNEVTAEKFKNIEFDFTKNFDGLTNAFFDVPQVGAAILQDGGELSLAKIEHNVRDISASSFENYHKCPMIFAARKIFALKDDSPLDLDPDNSGRGRLAHKVLQKILEPSIGMVAAQIQFSDTELEKMIEEARIEVEFSMAEERIWPSLRSQMLDLAKSFVKKENELRVSLPNLTTVGLESSIEGYWSEETGMMSKTPVSSGFYFKGFIDRIDADNHDNMAILDYKSSASKLSQFSPTKEVNDPEQESWIKNGQFQVGIYAMAVESGCVEGLPKSNVVAAQYYVLKNLSRGTGFRVIPDASQVVDVESSERNKITSERKQQFMQNLGVELKKILARIKEGDIAPNPRDRKDCNKCEWSQLCRAPHLN